MTKITTDTWWLKTKVWRKNEVAADVGRRLGYETSNPSGEQAHLTFLWCPSFGMLDFLQGTSMKSEFCNVVINSNGPVK